MPETLAEYADKERSSPFLWGHVSLRDYEAYFSGVIYATFLRDPVDRTISQYKSWHNPDNFRPGDHHYEGMTGEQRAAIFEVQQSSLEEFINTKNDYVISTALGNLQTLMLSTKTNVALAEHLESAKKNLHRFTFLGITEKFVESIERFRQIFPDAPEYRLPSSQENRSIVNPAPLSDELTSKIREQVFADAELYNYANELFAEAGTRPHEEQFTLSALGG
jgi:hypothetical protein